MFNKAINRIKNIEYENFGKNPKEEDGDLVHEYLRRLANFYNENKLKPLSPLVSNIAYILGDTSKILLEDYFTNSMVELLNFNLYNKYIVEYYLQLAKYSEIYPGAGKYLSVYEPLIHIYERGGLCDEIT